MSTGNGEPQTVVIANAVSDCPMSTRCQYCKQQIITVTHHKIGAFTWLSGFVCCFISCCCIPFLFDSFKDTVHYCPSCGRKVAVYHKL